MTSPIGDFAGARIYLDTMLPYALLRAIDVRAKDLFNRIEEGELRAYTSALTFDELAYRLLLAAIRDKYGPSPLDLLRTDERRYISEFAPAIVAALQRLRRMQHLGIVDVLASDLAAMERSMATFHLRPRDALQLAAMTRIGCMDILSTDAHFDRAPDVRRFTLGDS